VGPSELWIINSKPLIDEMITHTNMTSVLLAKVFDSFELSNIPIATRSPASLIRSNFVLSESIEFLTFVNGYSKSLFLPPNQTISRMNIAVLNEQRTIFDVSNLTFSNAASFEFSSNHAISKGGFGYYASITSSNITIHVEGENLSVSWVSLMSGQESYQNISAIDLILTSDLITIISRIPTLQSNGEILLRECYCYGNLYDSLRSAGNDLLIQGEVVFEEFLSDTSILLNNFYFSGSSIMNPDIVDWEPTSSLHVGAIWSLVLFLIWLIIIYIRKQPIDKAIIGSTAN
jgi:hypothetical protein